MKHEWELFLKEHENEFDPAIRTEYERYAAMKPNEVMIDFMDCHKDWPYPISIQSNATSYTQMIDVIAFSDDYDEYKDLPFAPYAPIIKDCYRPYAVTCRITDTKTDLNIHTSGLKFVNKAELIEDDATSAACEITTWIGKPVKYKGYVYLPADAKNKGLAPITDKDAALKFISEHKNDIYKFHEYICDGGGYYSSYPWLEEYFPDCSGYLECDPVRLCISNALLDDPDIIAALTLENAS